MDAAGQEALTGALLAPVQTWSKVAAAANPHLGPTLRCMPGLRHSVIAPVDLIQIADFADLSQSLQRSSDF
jgi:hypothetical protein